MSMKRVIVFIFLLAGIVHTLEAQILPFRTYSIENGLSESVVNELIQDQEGYMWIGTSYGLNRFDGINFKNYYNEDGLLDNDISALYEDNNGQLWIGTNSGVNVMRADSLHTLPELRPLESSTILAIYQDQYGEFWFATDGEGVWNFDGESGLSQYRAIHGLGGDRVRDIVEDEEGTLWFATREGLTKLESGNFRTYSEKHGLPDNRLRDLELDSDGSLWVASRGGFCKLEDEEFDCFTEENGLINNRVQSISIDNTGNLWLGTEEGASYFSDGEFTNFSIDEGLDNNIIHVTYLDREGLIWFGTFGGGISAFLGNQFHNYTVEQGLPNNVITSITEDQTGQYWIGTYGGGISNIRDGEIVNYRDSNGLVDNKVYMIRSDDQNRLLIGTRWGLSIYDGNDFHNYNETVLPARKIRSLLKPEQSSGIWLGTYGDGIIRFEDGQFERITEEDGLADNTVMSLEETDDGSIWIATYGGISKFDESGFTNYSIRDGLPNNGVLDILKDNSGQLWFATYGGIARFDDGNFETITGRDGLPDEVCYFIEQDNRGIYWIGTNNGVVRFDYESYQAKEETEHKQAFKLITQDQGLVANEMNAGASYKDSRGHLWFGSVGGITVFNPEEERVNVSPPVVHIESMQVSGETIPIESNLEIGSDNQNITFEFIGISFTAPEQVHYRYRLRNSGEGWQHTDQRSVRYSTLPSGEYIFQVRAQNSDGQWSENIASVQFSVLAPFWLQWWFIALVVITLIGILLFAYNHYRIRKMVEIERMRVRIASDLHDDVGSALTEIALQSDFLQTMEVPADLEDSLKQIGNQSRKIVSSLDDIVWSIDARNDTVGDLTDRMQDYVNNVLPDKEIKYHFEGNMQEKLKVSWKENIYLIFKEAINNISKHSNADRIDITLSTNGNGFLMSVKDNGTVATNERKTGQGLHNMKMRAKRIDADINLNQNGGFEVRVEKA